MPELILAVKDYEDWINIYPTLENYIVNTGYRLVLWNEMFNCLIPTNCVVSTAIIELGLRIQTQED